MSAADEVLEWLVANGQITREELEVAEVFVCRTSDEDGETR